MKPLIRSFYSTEIDDLENFHPENPRNFCFSLSILVGPSDGLGEESFDIIICTPQWLMENHPPSAILMGRHYLILFEYDYNRLINFIRKHIENCSGNNWEEIAIKIGRLGRWEFEDYHE